MDDLPIYPLPEPDNTEPEGSNTWKLVIIGILMLGVVIAGLIYAKNNLFLDNKEIIVNKTIETPIIETPIEVYQENETEQKLLILELSRNNWQNTLTQAEEIKKANEIARAKELASHHGGGGSSVSEDLPDTSTPSEFENITMDLNGDGIVNATDIKLLRNWKEVWYQNYNNSVDTYVNESTSDWDKNGYIDQTDKDLFEGYWTRLYNYYKDVLNVTEEIEENETQ